MKLTCILIDDEPGALEVLREYVGRASDLELKGDYRNPLRALEYLRENPVDLVFLDINMPDLTGLELLHSLIRPPGVIFTTAYPEFAVESYDYDAVDYLLKPIEFDRFLKAVGKARERIAAQGSVDAGAGKNKGRGGRMKTLLLKSGQDLHQVKIFDLLYLQAAGNYVIFVTGKKRIMVLMTIKEALEKLGDPDFFQIHRSYAVNFRHVDVIENTRVSIGGTFLPIGKTFREAFHTFLADRE